MRILAFLDSAPGGDWPPLLGLAAVLKRQGHTVVAVCDPALAESARGAGCQGIEVPVELGLARCLQPALEAMFAGVLLPSLEDPSPLAAWGKRVAVAACDLTTGFVPDLVLSTLFCQEAAMEAARILRRPWVVVNPSFFFGDRSHLPNLEDFSPLGWLMYRHWLLPPLQCADLVLHATDPLFDHSGSLPAGHLYLGPLFWETPGELPPVIPSPGPQWLLLSLSTSPQRGEQQILEQAGLALAERDCRVLVTLASPDRHLDLSQLPANFFVCGYVPHRLLLPFCRLALSHGGHGLVMKAMAHGVMQLLVPLGRDQAGVAIRAAALGVAKVIQPRDLHGPRMAGMLRDLLADPVSLAHTRSHAQRLATMRFLPGVLQRLQRLAGQVRSRR